jgi:ATP-dependent exoDNAse (exonuclease V) beta subunit
MNIDVLQWSKFNMYTFYENIHKYYWYDKPVKYSVTQFVSTFFDEFDKQGIAQKYSLKHNIPVDQVLNKWKFEGDLASTTGTIIHSYLENRMRGKVLEHNFSEAKVLGIYEDVVRLTNHLIPQVDRFVSDCWDKLIPMQMEYTVGIDDLIAGNIDLLCYNKYADEFQIWDYKNVKQMNFTNDYKRFGKYEFSNYLDCNHLHYSIQLNLYKCIIQRKLPNIKIGGCYLVHFSTKTSDFNIYPCMDLQIECNRALDRLILQNTK